MPEHNGDDATELDASQMNAIIDLIYAGQKIQAVKEYRDLRGTSLKESKDFVEELESELRGKSPDKFTVSKGGCAGVLLFFAVSFSALCRLVYSAVS